MNPLETQTLSNGAPNGAHTVPASAQSPHTNGRSFQDPPFKLPTVAKSGNDLVTAKGNIVLHNIAPGVTVRPYGGESDGAFLGAVVGFTNDAPPAALVDAAIGELVCTRFMALARAKLYWMQPSWGGPYPEDNEPSTFPTTNNFPATDLPVETQMLLLELDSGRECAVILPLIDGGVFRASMRPPSRSPRQGHSPSSLVARLESGDESVKSNSFADALYILAGTDPFDLMERGIATAVQLSGCGRPRTAKPVPEMLDVFGWCTWDAFYTDVNPAGIQRGLQSLAAGGTPAKFIVIDDGWQQTELDAEFRRFASAAGGAASGMRSWRAKAVKSRRLGAEVLFQDLQITEPLKVAERDRVVEEEEEEGEKVGWVNIAGRMIMSVWDAVIGRIEGAVIRILKQALEGSPSDSSAIEIWTALATGPFKKPLLRFYAAASSHSRRLLSVKANGKFSHLDQGPDAPLHSQSDSFGDVIRGLKERHGVQYVLCWQALAGYWSGIMPGAPETAPFDPEFLYPRPSPGTLEVDPSMAWVHPAVAGWGVPRNVVAFHKALHSYLAACGVDGVKVDVQASVVMFGWDSGGYAAIASRFHASLEDSVAEHFNGRNAQLNSMCCSIEDLYNFKHSNIARVGEDFYPLLPASHRAHIANAAFTTCFIGAVAFGDYDMFHSAHDAANLHAAARAISGGPTYVSDRVGDHDFELLRRLVLPNGGVLRCLVPGRPTADCLFCNVSADRVTALKIWNLNPYTGVVGAFNVQGARWVVKRRSYFVHDPNPPRVTASVKPSDVPGLEKEGRYAVYSEMDKTFRVFAGGETFDRSLAAAEFDLFVISQVMQSKEINLEVAPVGLVNMYNTGGAIRSCIMEERGEAAGGERGSCVVHLGIKGCGEFLLYASQAPERVQLDGKEVEFSYEAATGELRFEVAWHDGRETKSAVFF